MPPLPVVRDAGLNLAAAVAEDTGGDHRNPEARPFVLHRLRDQDDAGISLIETVVAMLLFGVFATVIAGYLVNTLNLTESNTQRVTAANLAAGQMEFVRGSRTLDLYTEELADKPVIAGTEYTIRRDVRFVEGLDGGSVCLGTADRLAYKLVTVLVSWPGMGNVKPVRSDTLKTLGLGRTEADLTKGAAAVLVQGSSGQPQSGVVVTLSPGSLVQTTGSDGCVVFPNLTPGVEFTASVSQSPSFVGLQGEQVVSGMITPEAGKVARTALNYERAGSLAISLASPPGYQPPGQLPMTLDRSGFTPVTTRAFPDCSLVSTSPQNCVSGVTRTATALFPGRYQAWAGSCLDAKPAAPVGQDVTAGGSTATSTQLGAIRLTLSGAAATSVGAAPVYAYHEPGPGCPAGQVWQLVAVTNTDRRLALPPGRWSLGLNADGSDAVARGTWVVVANQVTTVSYA